ncbi:Two-component response regulator [Thalictrum thalictroides]|uniref:Two-component response regulator n=1 Tax=Thalictrum thalictroides TaxID=46969 RepID=A0A7J6UTL7_THATH|nr:Two-component response regulator [Thalictrum thalictroides]
MASTSNEKMKALIVDDETLIRKMHSKLLQIAGFDTQEALNGKEAVDLCSSGAVFDIIFMDLVMPVMKGPQATRLLREMKVACKIIGVTGQTEADEIKEFREAGLDECLEKPLTHAKISSIIEGLKNTQT